MKCSDPLGRMNRKINEAKQVGTLYHFTTASNAVSILRDNILGKKRDAVSFTRDKNFPKSVRHGIYPEVGFILDGDLLSNKYKVEPYSFQGTVQKVPKGDLGPEWDESEEYIDTAVVDVQKYIKGILIDRSSLVEVDNSEREFYGQLYRKKIFTNAQRRYLKSLGFNITFRVLVLKKYFESLKYKVEVI